MTPVRALAGPEAAATTAPPLASSPGPRLPAPPAYRIWVIGHVGAVVGGGPDDIAVGGAALLARHLRGPVEVVAGGLSAAALGERGVGRVALELTCGVAGPFGSVVGLALAPHLDLDVDRIRGPRPGAAATLWVFAGVAPYLRLSTTQDAGLSGELGLAIALPTLRW